MPQLSVSQQSFMEKRHREIQRIKLIRLLIFFVFLALWEITTRAGLLDSFFFSSPSRVLTCLYGMIMDFSIFRHVGVTLAETMISFFLVICISILTAMLLWHSRGLSHILEPYLVVLNSLPKSALAPLFLVWLGSGMKTIVVAGISVAVFGSIISLYSGFSTTDEEKIKLIYTLGGTKRDVFYKVVFPSSIPVIISTMKVNIGLALVGVIIGEFIGAREGLGYLIIYGSQVFSLAAQMTVRKRSFPNGVKLRISGEAAAKASPPVWPSGQQR